METNHISPEDAGSLGKVYWQVEQQDLAKVVPNATALPYSSDNLQHKTRSCRAKRLVPWSGLPNLGMLVTC